MKLDDDEIRTWSRHIRELAPTLTLDGGRWLPPEVFTDLAEFLSDLLVTDVRMANLRATKVHLALIEMTRPGSKWPFAVRGKAKLLLRRWGERFGSLEDVTSNLWAEGGRMHGVVKLRGKAAEFLGESGWVQKTIATGRTMKSAWSISGGMGPAYPMQSGHIRFKVGDWWIKPAAAYRDGIIHSSGYGITADDIEAYAVVMTKQDEIEPNGEGRTRYQASPEDPGKLRLVRNVLTQNPVRVLRAWKLESELAPQVGLRYDGLYLVKGYGIRMTSSEDRDQWHFTFTLERGKEQPGIEMALAHPTSDELYDWHVYKQQKHEHVQDQPTAARSDTGFMSWSDDDSAHRDNDENEEVQ